MNKKPKVTLSIVLATYNEAANIERCLKAVGDIADEIVVVDGNSTDNTAQLAKKMGALVVQTSNKPIFHINKQAAIDKATSVWILQLDADEVVDDQLKRSIEAIVKEGSQYQAFYIKRKNYFLGRFLKKGGQYPDPVIRFFKRGKAKLPQKDVHEQMEVTGEVGDLAGHLLHYNAPTFSRYITNANRYTSLTAETMKRRGVLLTFSNDVSYLFWKPLVIFVSLFIRHRGYQDGFVGLVFALFSGLHQAIAYMKLGDLYRHENSH